MRGRLSGVGDGKPQDVDSAPGVVTVMVKRISETSHRRRPRV